jgi:hypothetical protein
MTDLTTDLEGSKKPYHDYDEYTFRVLFPGMMDHIILQPAQVTKTATWYYSLHR